VRYEERGQGYRDVEKVGKHWSKRSPLVQSPGIHQTFVGGGSVFQVLFLSILHTVIHSEGKSFLNLDISLPRIFTNE